MARQSTQTRLIAVSALAIVLLAFGSLSFVRRVMATEPEIGVEWAQSSGGAVVLEVDERGAAWKAGLRRGDLLVEIDGRPVSSVLDAAQIGWAAGDDSIALKVRRGAEEQIVSVEPDRPGRSEPYVYMALVGLAFWASGLFIAVRWPAIRGGMVYSILSMALFAELTLSHSGVADPFDWVVYWCDLAAAAVVPALLVHFGIALSKRTLHRRQAVTGVAYGFSAALLLAAVWLSPAALGGAYRFDEPLLAIEAHGRVEALFLSMAWLATVSLLVKSFARSSSILHRSQIKWLLWGLIVGLGPYVLLQAIPWAAGAPELPTWAMFVAVAPMLVIPASFTAALARYRLYDLDLFLLRGFSEVAAVFAASALLSALGYILREGLGDLLPLSRSGTRYVAFFFTAVSYPKLRAWTRVGVERAFYRKRYSYRATMLDWARELNAETDLASLLKSLRARVRETLGIPEAVVLLRTSAWRFLIVEDGEPSRQLEFDASSIERLEREPSLVVESGTLTELPWARFLYSMKVKGRLTAVLAIAERRQPEEPLSSEDRALLGTLAAHAATAIDAARLLQQVRQRADEVERLHERQARILESSAVGLLLLDANQTIEAWNRALEEIYGLPRTAALGKKLSDVLPLHVVRQIEREEAHSRQAGERRIFRLSLANRRGKRIIVNIAITPVEGDPGKDGARVLTFDDVTERVELEQQVSRQERLASLGLLAAGVAHEINTPLTGISGYAQMLLEEMKADDPHAAVLEKIEEQTHRAARIANSLLNLARPEQTVVEALDVGETIQEVVHLFRPQIRGRGAKLAIEVDDDLPRIPGHRGKLQQVLLNLLINARDAVGEEGIVRLAARCGDDCVVIEVMDNGVGILEEDLPNVFDPFFTTKGRGMGTGLGLSISYGIVREHQGEIHVESTPGVSTVFRIELPLTRSAQALA